MLSLDKYPIEIDYVLLLEDLNDVLSYIFFFEMLLKLIGLGFKAYASDSFNVFDCCVVMIWVVEKILHYGNVKFEGGGAISALRAVRLLRVFKLARSWVSFRILLGKITETVKDISTFSVLLALFMFIFLLLGMELFAYKIFFNNDDKERIVEIDIEYNPIEEIAAAPRVNFNDPWYGFITIFIIFIGEDWNSAMYDHVRGTSSWSIIFFVLIFIAGNLILLNLFLAILLKRFEEPPRDEHEEEEDDEEDEEEEEVEPEPKVSMS